MSQMISRRLRDCIAISPEIGLYAPRRSRADHALEFVPISSTAVMGAPHIRVLRGGSYRRLSHIDGTHNVEAGYLAKTSDTVDVGVIRNPDSQTRDKGVCPWSRVKCHLCQLEKTRALLLAREYCARTPSAPEASCLW